MTELLRELEAVVRLNQIACAAGNLSTAAVCFIRTHHAEIAEAVKDARTEREIQNAADKLPPGYILTIYIESGSGYIDLTNPEGDPVHVDTDDKGMAQQIAEATRIAAIDAHNSAREVGE